MRLGDFEIHTIVENRFRIDGGSMFGVVPKLIWRNLVEADADNLVQLDMNVLLIRTPKTNILVDTGMGDALTERQRKIFGIEKGSGLGTGLLEFGLKCEDIDFVILSHLHADHAGGTVSLKNGQKVPNFPLARHVVQKAEWDDARHPNERTRAAYLTENLEVLDQHQLVEPVEGDAEVVQGVNVRLTGGHCRGHQIVEVTSQNQKLIYPGDILPTAAHIRIPYIAGVDTYPLDTLQTKKELFPRIASEGWIVAMDHDLNIKLGKFEQKDGKLAVVGLAN